MVPKLTFVAVLVAGGLLVIAKFVSLVAAIALALLYTLAEWRMGTIRRAE